MGIVKGGKNIYGIDIGIIMLDSSFPRIPGDVGNAKTWDFPVLYKKVCGAFPQKIVTNLSREDIGPFIIAAKELEADGVKAISTSCGFLALFQKELAQSVNIPVLTSALLMVPIAQRMVGEEGKIGILTANSETLTERHLEGVGITKTENIIIYGLQEKDVFSKYTMNNWSQVDTSLCKEELISTTIEMMSENDGIKAIVLECTNMPPFSVYIQEAAGVPVFDIVTLIYLMYNSLNPPRFREY